MGSGFEHREEIRSYKDLIAWQRGMDLVTLVYRVSARFPADERFGLISQIRRAAVSVPSNIAEGYGRGSRDDYHRFLRLARGSLFEVETQALIAHQLEFITKDDAEAIENEVNATARVLSGLIKSIGK